jgi:hypothetical protein
MDTPETTEISVPADHLELRRWAATLPADIIRAMLRVEESARRAIDARETRERPKARRAR